MTAASDDNAPDQDPQAVPRTVFALNPGGRLGAQTAPRAAPLGLIEAESSRPGVNKLVDAAADLFDLVVYLRGQNMPVDIGPLRDKTIALVKQFEKRALAEGEPQKVVAAARYAIAATIDDQVMSKPWGTDSGWQNAKLVNALHGEVIGGERFFEYLNVARKDPSQFKSLIEFFYICLSLGFRGRFRRGKGEAQLELDQHRVDAYRTVEQMRGGTFADRLSLHWKGVNTTRKPISHLFPTWLMAAVSAAVVAALFFLFLVIVGEHSTESYARVRAMPPLDDAGVRAAVEVRRLAAPVPRQVVEVRPARLERVREFLEYELEEGLVDVFEEGGEVRILLRGEGMFDPGKVEILPRYEEVLQRVADALNDEPGDVVIEGHTDSIQPRRTARYPTNLALAEERANAVRAFIDPVLTAPERVTTRAYGETRPIADNATPEGRARNRRVELLLIRPPAGEDDTAEVTE